MQDGQPKIAVGLQKIQLDSVGYFGTYKTGFRLRMLELVQLLDTFQFPLVRHEKWMLWDQGLVLK